MGRLTIAFVMVLCFAPTALAYSRSEVDLARVCVAEVGWYGSADECAAIGHILTSRAAKRGVRFSTMARLYSRRAFRLNHPRGWLAQLRGDARRPARWPPSLRWASVYAPLWVGRLAQAAAIFAGSHPPDHCDEPPDHWGAPYGIDRVRSRRAVAAGRWRAVDCGPDSRNEFFALTR